LFANWNKTFIPEFQGMPLERLFPDYVEPFVATLRARLVEAGELPAG
jgi:hypothetical protein